MDKIKIICQGCKTDMVLISESGVGNHFGDREIWSCNNCHLEVMVRYG